MSRVQTNPDFFKQIKSLAAQVASLQRIALTTNSAVGDLIPSAAPSRPGGLLCDGAAYSRTTYATLFDAIGTAYGVGDGSTTFNVPDLRGRLPLGAGTGTASGATGWTLGQQPAGAGVAGGEQTHTLSSGEIPAHSHGVNDPQHSHSYVGNPSANNVVTTTYANGVNVFTQTGYTNATTGSASTGISIQANTGGGGSHNILPPVSVVNWFIIY